MNQSLFVAQSMPMEDPRNSTPNRARWNIDKVRFHLDTRPAPNREIRGIQEILRDVMEGLEQPQCENMLILRDAWPELVGPQIARHSQPLSLEYFTLRIGVDHPGWMPELKRTERLLLHQLQSRYPDLRIRRLHLQLLHR